MIAGYRTWIYIGIDRNYRLPEEFLQLPADTQKQCLNDAKFGPMLELYLESLPSLIKELM